ncbi:MAG: hypothetical protein IPJ03_21495 [Ignavibacteriales bacterium]|nr:hypothetical protein [Ignavibacteriales bacterium]
MENLTALIVKTQELDNKLNEAETQTELGILYKLTKKNKQSKQAFSQAFEYYQKIGAANEINKIQELST